MTNLIQITNYTVLTNFQTITNIAIEKNHITSWNDPIIIVTIIGVWASFISVMMSIRAMRETAKETSNDIQRQIEMSAKSIHATKELTSTLFVTLDNIGYELNNK